MARRDLTNQKFGRLTVLKEFGKNKSGHIIWQCQCDCGNMVNCLASNITTGKTKSCGCIRIENTIKQNIEKNPSKITGKRFGRLVVLRKIIDNNTAGRNKYECQCDCGNITYVLAGDLCNGKTESCGCSRSKGNQLILSELQKSNCNFESKYKISYNRKRYFFDFAIFDDNKKIKCFIEFDGQQHYYYQKNTNGWNTKEHFEKVKKSDKEKNRYCKEKSIPLVRIPYWDFNKISLEYLKERIKEVC